MKIYFAGSIRGGRDDKDLYLEIIKHLSKYGEVLTEHICDKKLTELGEDGLSNQQIYNRDMKRLKESDILIAEVSTTSLGVGYEIAQAENMKKEILCLYRKTLDKRLSAMIGGSPNLKIAMYKEREGLKNHIDTFIQKLNN